MLYMIEFIIVFYNQGHVRNGGINGVGYLQQSIPALYNSGRLTSVFAIVLLLQRFIAAVAFRTAMTQASVNSMRGDESPFYTFAYSVWVVLSVYSWTRQVTEPS